ncbi:MAG: DUF3054 domain-containing protein [Streptosporangiaceae bacterium]|jgi:hypothetical protein
MRAAGAFLADLCCVLVFVVIGRANHHAGGGAAGLADTAWPFLVAAALGTVVTRAWRRPVALVPTGVCVWLCTVAVGMLLRVVSGQGTAFAFILVALAFLGLFQLGWRVVVSRAALFASVDTNVRSH